MILTRKDYYSTKFVLYELCKQLKYRYLSIRRIINNKGSLARYYLGYSVELLTESLKRNNVLEEPTAKIYFDLATWFDDDKNTPMFSYERKQRKEDKINFTKKQDFKNLIKSYDFAIDLDCKTIKTAWREAKKIKELFDECKLPYSIKFSGSKGFHFVIDDKYFELKIKPINRADLYGKVVNNILKDEKLKTVDTSIYDPRRILKLAYSLNNNKGIEYVALPLSDQQFNNFNYNDMRLSEVMRKTRIFQRGLLERNHGINEKDLKVNCLRFIKEYK